MGNTFSSQNKAATAVPEPDREAVEAGLKADAAAPRQAHIQVLEPEVLQAVTINVDSLQTEVGLQHLRATIAEYGFVVVRDVLSSSDVTLADALWSDDLRSIIVQREGAAAEEDAKNGEDTSATFASTATLLRRGEESTTFPSDAVKAGLFVSTYGLAQGRCPWFVRRHPNVHAVFSALYPEANGELCVGTDSIFYRSKKLEASENPDDLKDDLWPHVDLDDSIQPSGSWKTYQSVVYIWGADNTTQSTVVMPRGNGDAAKREFLADAPRTGSHYRHVRPRHFAKWIDVARRVPVPPGGMIVWATDTLHQGWALGHRLAVPVCMEPKTRRDEGALLRKRRAVRRGLTSTHWASQGMVHGRILPPRRFAGGPPNSELHHRAHWHLRVRSEQREQECADVDSDDIEIEPAVDALL